MTNTALVNAGPSDAGQMVAGQAIAGQVGSLLYKLEMLIDEAVCCGAELTAALPRARVEARLPALVGQHSLDTLTEAVQSLVAARRQTVATHKHLDKVRELMGLQVISFGEERPKPEDPKPLAVEGPRTDHLRIAA